MKDTMQDLEKTAAHLTHLLSKFSHELCNSMRNGGVTMEDVERLNMLQKELNDFVEKEKEDQYCEISGAKLDRPKTSKF